jgi:hypothetical protein
MIEERRKQTLFFAARAALSHRLGHMSNEPGNELSASVIVFTSDSASRAGLGAIFSKLAEGGQGHRMERYSG